MTAPLTPTATGVPGDVATLTVYVERGCTSCGAAREVAEQVREKYPEVDVRVFDLGDVSSEDVPTEVFAAPTFLLDDEVVSLGTPARETLPALLERAPIEDDAEGEGGSVATTRSRSIPAPEPTPCLMESELFRDLGEREMSEIERTTTMSSCKRGTVFFAPEETGEVLFILKAGRVNLYRVTEEGKKLVTATLEPGSVFGEMALAGQGMNGSFAEASEDCTLCLMSREDVQRVIHQYPRSRCGCSRAWPAASTTPRSASPTSPTSRCRRESRRRCCGCRDRTTGRSTSRTRTLGTWLAPTAKPRRAS